MWMLGLHQKINDSPQGGTAQNVDYSYQIVITQKHTTFIGNKFIRGFMLQGWCWRFLVDEYKNSPSFVSSFSAPLPSPVSSLPEETIKFYNFFSAYKKSVISTFLFSFCFFFLSLTISRSSMVSSKESPDFLASAGNGSFTSTWKQIWVNFWWENQIDSLQNLHLWSILHCSGCQYKFSSNFISTQNFPHFSSF